MNLKRIDMDDYQLIGPFSQLLPMSGLPLKGPLSDTLLPVISNAGILVKGQYIQEIGHYFDLLPKARKLGASIDLLDGNHVCLPGFVDAHTHICFAGSRAKDYAQRNAGRSYLEIADSGGGIWDTVTQTRNATAEMLVHHTVNRANMHLGRGITTIEVKSGYGLSLSEELKMLRAIKEANDLVSSDLVPTCLAAHMLPRDFDGTPKEYLRQMAQYLFPILKQENLTQRMDAFIERSAFTADDIVPYFTRAQEMGFDITVHADQFSTGGSGVAIRFKALSADHLEASTQREVQALAQSNVIALALPGASVGLGCDFAPARKILDAGGALAIASDWNPGSAPMGDLLVQAALLGSFQKLTNTEVLAGITFRAASALNLQDRGTMAAGKIADMLAFPAEDHTEILYHQGSLKPDKVWKKGRLVVDKTHEDGL
ncbi:MAG: imidazolonepropionase [Sediminicola sp.]|tara:strand:+ start:103746 stop:105032 length:1287 start_codon:yes stop_codon:yes gene_type:complete